MSFNRFFENKFQIKMEEKFFHLKNKPIFAKIMA